MGIDVAGVEMDARAHDMWAVGSLFVYVLTQDGQWFAPALSEDSGMETFELRKQWVSAIAAVVQVNVRPHQHQHEELSAF